MSCAKYDLDRASNMEMLPVNLDAVLPGFSDDFPYHRGSHRQWNAHAESVADEVLRNLRKKKNLPKDLKPSEVVEHLTEQELEAAADFVERQLRIDLLDPIHWYPDGHPMARKLK